MKKTSAVSFTRKIIEFFKHPASGLLMAGVLGVLIIITTIIVSTFVFDKPTKFFSSNKLSKSSNPYLLQHSNNPIKWHEWGDEAFAKARSENKPILLSIGYSACNWCHTMEKDVFSDQKLARLLNDSVVSIKVDREVRPDLDDIFITATWMLTKNAGYPNNIFLTHDLKPFLAIGYSKVDEFSAFCQKAINYWKDDSEATHMTSDEVANAVAKFRKHEPKKSTPSKSIITKSLQHFNDFYDEKFGGFYQTPKFILESASLFLIANYKMDNNKDSLEMARNTFENIFKGSVFDHVNGGIHAYAKDAKWQVPAFEKMLYNQALSGLVLSELFSISQSPLDKYKAQKTLGFVLNNLSHKDGGFYSSVDSEIDGVNGAYYSWLDSEIKMLLDEKDWAWFNNHYELIDFVKTDDAQKQRKTINLIKVFEAKDITRNDRIMNALSKAKGNGQQPIIDVKIITSWNALMIRSLARSGIILKKQEYIEAARKTADFILNNMITDEGKLMRIYNNGRISTHGFFEDYALTIRALISLYKATADGRYISNAVKLIDIANQLFLDHKNHGYFFSSENKNFFVNLKNAKDLAIPSGNSSMAHALLDLYEITDDQQYKQEAQKILKAFAGSMAKNPTMHINMVNALMRYYNIEEVEKKNIIKKSNKSFHKDSSELPSIYTQDYVDVEIAKDVTYSLNGSKASLIVKMKIKDGWHVNANPATLDFLIPTLVDVRTRKGIITVENVDYPEAMMINLPLGELDLYEGKISIPVTFSKSKDVEQVRILVRTQACKNTSCLLPSDWVFPVKLN